MNGQARGRLAALPAAAAVLLLPLLWRDSGFAQSLLAQVGAAVVACLAYRLLLAEGGLMSFGHAVYLGLGGYAAAWALNHAAPAGWPVSLVPLAGAAAGALAAALLGWPSTRHRGTAFAMITLGLAELVGAAALMLPEWFGGEAGVSANRVVGQPVMGISFGPAVQVTVLVLLYALVAGALLVAYPRTPAGLLLRAARDNPDRVAATGHDPQVVRWLAFVVSGAGSGLAGALSLLVFERVTADALGTAHSGWLLVFVWLGGVAVWWGGVLGAVLMVLSQTLLAAWTPAWALYLGLLFMGVLLLAPGGLAGGLMALAARWRVARRDGADGVEVGRAPAAPGPAGAHAGGGARAALPGQRGLVRAGGPWQRGGQATGLLLATAGGMALVEMAYQRQLADTLGPVRHIAGLGLDTASPWHWAAAGGLLAAGLVLLWRARRREMAR